MLPRRVRRPRRLPRRTSAHALPGRYDGPDSAPLCPRAVKLESPLARHGRLRRNHACDSGRAERETADPRHPEDRDRSDHGHYTEADQPPPRATTDRRLRDHARRTQAHRIGESCIARGGSGEVRSPRRDCAAHGQQRLDRSVALPVRAKLVDDLRRSAIVKRRPRQRVTITGQAGVAAASDPASDPPERLACAGRLGGRAQSERRAALVRREAAAHVAQRPTTGEPAPVEQDQPREHPQDQRHPGSQPMSQPGSEIRSRHCISWHGSSITSMDPR